MVERQTPADVTQDLINAVRERLGYYPSQLKQALEGHALPAIFATVSQRPKEATELYARSIDALKNLLLNMLPEEPEEGDFLQIEWPIELLEEKIPAAIRMCNSPDNLINALKDQSLTRISVLALGEKPSLTPTDKELLTLEDEMLLREPTIGEIAGAGHDLIYPFSVHQDPISEAWILGGTPLSDLRTVLDTPSALESETVYVQVRNLHDGVVQPAALEIEIKGVWVYIHQDNVCLPNPWELAATRGNLGDKFGRVGMIITNGPNNQPQAALFTRPTHKPEDTKQLDDRYLKAVIDIRKQLVLASSYEPLAKAAREGRWADVDYMVDPAMWSVLDQRAREPVDSRYSGHKFREILEAAYREQLVKLGAYIYEHGPLEGEDLALSLTEFVMKYQDRLTRVK